jgi:hypothetical protein
MAAHVKRTELVSPSVVESLRLVVERLNKAGTVNYKKLYKEQRAPVCQPLSPHSELCRSDDRMHNLDG